MSRRGGAKKQSFIGIIADEVCSVAVRVCTHCGRILSLAFFLRVLVSLMSRMVRTG